MEFELCYGCMTEGIDRFPCPVCGWHNESEPESYLYLKSGSKLNDQYLIGRVLGHGGFGITYLALDTRLKIKLAVKEFLPREYAARDSTDATVSVHSGTAKDEFAHGLEKFLEEAQNVARFQGHPGIVGVLNFFEANGTGYMVMPYVEGTTLKEYLQSQPEQKISYEKAIGIFMPVLDALREVHQAGMLHRDISPDNIYITTTGQVKLLDFGAARFAMGEHSKSLSIVLKPGYSPREQYSAKGKQGAWTDIYAVAASLYRSITGVVPDDALDRLEDDELRAPGELVSIPPEVEQAILTAMSVNARNRFQTIEAFQAALFENQQINSEPAPSIHVSLQQPSSLPQQPSDTSSSVQQQATDDTIIDTVRRRLIRLGYKIKATGPLDERTIAAIQQFEQENSLPVVGKVDEVLAEEVAERYFELERTEWETFLSDFKYVLDEPEKAKSLIVAYLDRWPDTRHQEDIDNKYWDCIYNQASGQQNPELIQEYLNLFPDGIFTSQIIQAKKDIQQELDDLLDAAEDSLWASSLESLDSNLVNEYKREYPQGKYINEVDSRKEEIVWKKAAKTHHMDSYKGYLKQYPNGEYELFAKRALEELLWQEGNKSLDFEEYLEFFPGTDKAKGIPDLIERRAWEKVQSFKNDAVYELKLQEFIDNFPETERAESAKELKEEACWKKVQSYKNDAVYELKLQEFINNFPETERAESAEELKEEACWKKAVVTGTEDAFGVFLNQYPSTTKIVEVKELRTKLIRAKHRNNLIIRSVLYTTIFVLASSIYFKDWQDDAYKRAYSAAQKENTVSAFEKYIQEFPNTEFYSSAIGKLLELDLRNWKLAIEENSVEGFRKYLSSESRLFFKTEADEKIWKIASETNTIKSYNEYISAIPEGEYVDSAKSKLEKLNDEVIWKDFNNNILITEYQQYIKKYPQSHTVNYARHQIRSLLLESIESKTLNSDLVTEFMFQNMKTINRHKNKVFQKEERSYWREAWQTMDNVQKLRLFELVESSMCEIYSSLHVREKRRLESFSIQC